VIEIERKEADFAVCLFSRYGRVHVKALFGDLKMNSAGE